MSDHAQNGFLLVGSICELANKSSDDVGEGCLAYVADTGQYFKMTTDASPLTPNGSTVITTWGGPAMAPCAQSTTGTGIGRWVLTNLGSIVNPFAAETAWFIDPVAGVDTNTGLTALSPLKTFNALAARWAGITEPTSATVTVSIIDGANLSTGDQVVINRPVNPLFPILIEGALALTVVTTGVLTAFTALNRAANTSPQINGTLVVGAWAGYVGKIIRITADVVPANVGAWAIVVEALGGNNVRTTPFITQATSTTVSFVQVSPSNASTYEILEPVQLTDAVAGNLPYINVGEAGIVWFHDVNFFDNGLASPTKRCGVESARTIYAYRCTSDSITTYGVASCRDFVFGGSYAQFNQLDVFDGNLLILNSLSYITGTAGGTLTYGTDSTPFVGTSVTYTASHYEIGNVDISAALSPAINLPAFSTALFSGAVYGTGVATTHISLHNFAHAEYTGGATFPAVVAALQHPLDFQNAILKDYADLPFGSTATFADSQAFFLLQK